MSNNKISQSEITINGLRIASKTRTLEQIEKLRSSVEEKRQLLNKMYAENESANPVETNLTSALKPKQSMPATAVTTINILKHVHFESDDDEGVSQQIINSTYTTRTDKPRQTAKENQIRSNNTSKSPDRRTQTALKALKSPLKVNTKVNNNNNNSKTSKISNISRPILTVQQKRELELAKKAELRKALEILHVKVITRKYAYLWLRRFFYSRTRIQDSKGMLLLPSQVDKYRVQRSLGLFLNKWHKETCWVRNEWRLTVKAQCHHNYVILSKLWNCWRVYAAESRVENSLTSKAVEFRKFYFFVSINPHAILTNHTSN